jgi:hypothetical protein
MAKLIFLRKNILILKIKAFSNGFDFKIWSFVHLSLKIKKKKKV